MKWLIRLTVGDLWLKLLALLVAWALWFVAREDVEVEFPTRPLPIEVDETDNKGSFEVEWDDEFPTVRLTLRGSRTHRTQFEALDNPRATVHIVDGRTIPDGVFTKKHRFQLEDFEFPELVGSELRIENMKPSDGVSATIHRIAERSVKVIKPVLKTDVADIAYVDVKILSWPPDLFVTAHLSEFEPNAALQQIETYIDSATIERTVASLSGSLISQEVEVPLKFDDDRYKDVDMTFRDGKTRESALTARIQLSRVQSKEITIPISIHYASPDGRRGLDTLRVTYHPEMTGYPWFQDDPDQPTVTITVRGVPERVELLEAPYIAEQGIIAFVEAVPVPNSTNLAEAELRVLNLPAGVVLEVAKRISLTSAR